MQVFIMYSFAEQILTLIKYNFISFTRIIILNYGIKFETIKIMNNQNKSLFRSSINIYIPILTCLMLLVTMVEAQDLSKLYEKVNPAVVVILTEEKELVNTGQTTKTVTASGLGSGFMISDTQIVTAAHVVQVVENVQVQFEDREIIPAKVISAYKNSDLALIELVWPRKNAATLKLGDSDKVKIGQQVFVVGAPFGLDHTLSSGYISGIIKKPNDKNPLTNAEYIQTDAAINKGNSGGPMFNMDGEVIGVVSQILSQTGGFQGIGFAATSNLARELLLEKKILWSGMDAITLTGKLAEIFNLPQRSGLLVQRVVMLSPMGIMDLQGGDSEITIEGKKLLVGGDIILSFNGIQFDTTKEALSKIGEMAASIGSKDPFEMTVLRGGRVVSLKRK